MSVATRQVKLKIKGAIGQNGDEDYELPGVVRVTISNPHEKGSKRMTVSEGSEIVIEVL